MCQKQPSFMMIDNRISAEAHMGHTVTGGYPACCGDLDLILPNGSVDSQCSGHCVNQTQGPYSIANLLI